MLSQRCFACALCVSLWLLLRQGTLAAEFTPARIVVYFSPNGGATDAVVREVNAAQQQILVQAYSFTSAPIAKALVEAHKRGVKILAVLDKSNETDKYSAATFLVHAGIQTLIDDRHAIAHSKVMVIDSATILTGSFNFTKAAEERNAENLLVIKDAPALVKAYEANVQTHVEHTHAYRLAAALGPPDVATLTEREGAVRGNRHSKVYRVPACKRYAGMKNPDTVVVFATEAEAQHAGYRQAKDCR